MTMKRLRSAIVIALIGTSLSGCGSPSSIDAAAPDAMNGNVVARPTNSGSQQGTADAEGIACGSLTAPNGPDVVGVSVGMRAEDAYKAIACANRAMLVEYPQGGIEVPPMPDGTKPRGMVVGRAYGDRVEALLAGLPGQETVVFVRREVTFQPDQQPQAEALRQQLLAKYPGMTEDMAGSRYHAELVRTLFQPTSGVTGPCAPPLYGGMQIYSHCGPSIAIYMDPNPQNPQLAIHLIVSVADGSYGFRQLEAYRVQALGAQRDVQNQDAARAADRRPTL